MNPLHNLSNLSWHALIFLLEGTDFSEPWLGVGFATEIKTKILEAAECKAVGNVVAEGILRELKKKL